MKKMMKRTAVAALAGIMAAGLLAGCGQKKLDGTKTAATVNGEEIPLGIVSLVTRQQQAQMEAMYASFMGEDYNIWSQPAAEDSEKTFGEQMVEDVLKQIEIMYLMKEKASDYKAEVTEEDKTAIDEAAKAFMEANTEETIAQLGVTEDQVKAFLELETYRERVYNAILEEAAIEVTDEEAQQAAFTYVSISTSGEELTEEEIDARKEEAQAILDKVKEDPKADMDKLAKEADETYAALEGTFTAKAPKDEAEDDTSYPKEVIDKLRTLKEGEVASELIETESSLYIVRLDSEFDKEATESRKESLKSTREYDYFTETTEKWLEEADIKVEDKALEAIKVEDNQSFIMKTPAEDEALAEEGQAELENAEVIEDDSLEDAEIMDGEMSGIEDAETIDEELPEDMEEEALSGDVEVVEELDGDVEILDEEEMDMTTDLDLDAELD